MKKILLIAAFISSLCASSQTIDHILFDYDLAGNQVRRYVIDINQGKDTNPISKDISSLNEQELFSTDLYTDIKYYPNPVLQELYVMWAIEDDNHVLSIEVYSLIGQITKKIENLKGKNNAIINFDHYPTGYYNVILKYSKGDPKSLKIVKK